MFNLSKKLLQTIAKTKKRKWLYGGLLVLVGIFLWPFMLAGKLPVKSQHAWLGVLIILLNFGWLIAILGNTSEPQVDQQPEAAQTQASEVADTGLPAAVEEVEVQPEEVPGKYKVLEVVDGDTVKVLYEGTTETIRMIGVDTPETVDPREPVQCYGKEASQFTRDTLNQKTVGLEDDVTQGDRDKYGRLLRYVILEDGTNFNQKLIEAGYAFEYTYNIPYKYQTGFKQAQKSAQASATGLWAASTCSGQKSAAKNEASSSTGGSSAECKIKGNIASDKEKIYHTPGQRYYDKTVIDTSKGEKWFCSEAEAQQAGWRKSKV